jgi:hypothetical protein
LERLLDIRYLNLERPVSGVTSSAGATAPGLPPVLLTEP